MNKKTWFSKAKWIFVIVLIIGIPLYVFLPTMIPGVRKINENDIASIEASFFADYAMIDSVILTIDDTETINKLYDTISDIKVRRKMIFEFPDSVGSNVGITLFDAKKQPLLYITVDRPERIYINSRNTEYIVYNHELLDELYSICNEY